MKRMLALVVTLARALVLAGCETTDSGDRSTGSSGAHSFHGSSSGSGSCH